MKVAVIPARGGSKRLPRKNISHFGGKPMLVWSVEAAQESKIFDEIIVSTEDSEIASIASDCGATVLTRPVEIASDSATLMEVVLHTLEQYPEIEDICLLLANCPLRPAEEILRSEQMWRTESPSALLSVVDYLWTPPFRAQSMTDNYQLAPLMPEWMEQKSQEYPDTVCLTGAIYWGRSEILKTASSLFVEGICGFQMPWHLAIDIDTAEDMKVAECVRFGLDNGFSFEESEIG
jgi:pseudaminic acid cytidylyltransferase